MEIRGKSIAYSSYNKKQDKVLEDNLLKESDNLEKEENIDYEKLERKQSELENLRQKKWKG